jgi:hypothetical protein
MKKIPKLLAAAALLSLLGGCAVGQKLGWQRSTKAPANEVQVASCDMATATLKGRPDYDAAHRACVDAKARQHVD